MGFLYFIVSYTRTFQRSSLSAKMPQKLTLHHMWGGCPHVTKVEGTIVPATMVPATVTLHQATLTPAQGHGFTAYYKNPLFGNTQSQEFSSETGGFNNKAKGNFSGGYD